MNVLPVLINLLNPCISWPLPQTTAVYICIHKGNVFASNNLGQFVNHIILYLSWPHYYLLGPGDIICSPLWSSLNTAALFLSPSYIMCSRDNSPITAAILSSMGDNEVPSTLYDDNVSYKLWFFWVYFFSTDHVTVLSTFNPSCVFLITTCENANYFESMFCLSEQNLNHFNCLIFSLTRRLVF